VRAPEQNTGPNVFYLGADRAVLDPLSAPVDDTYIWAKPDAHRLETAGDLPGDPTTKARTTLNTAHPRPWGWRVTTYLWTKAVGAGAMLVAALAVMFGIDLDTTSLATPPVIGLAMAGVTGVLLVWDLKRPARFLYIFLKSNFTSWLVLGSYAIMAFGGVALAWLGVAVFGDTAVAGDISLLDVLSWLAVPAGVMIAGYTAFLFGQAEGRDLWQSGVLFWHLISQAVMVGAGALLVLAPLTDLSADADRLLARAFVLGIAAHLLIVAVEYGGKHASRNAAVAAHVIVSGRYAKTFWLGGVLLAVVAAGLGITGWSGSGPEVALVAGGLLAQVALIAYESVFVRAAQDVPLS
jgi:formate-dependent nitrite reductase membrane component NrfD